MNARINTLRRTAIPAALLIVVALSVQAAGGAAPALADGCSVGGTVEYCNYGGESIPKYTSRYFSAPGGNNLRRWFVNEVGDAYGGTVAKCAGYKPQGTGLGYWLACGYGTPAGEIPVSIRPGWIFIEHVAPGPRILYGQGRRSLLCC